VTSIHRSVKRITIEDSIYEKGKKRLIIAKLGPKDIITFRLHGCRFWTDGLPLKDLYWQALKRTVQRRWQEENEKRKADGKRPKKKPTLLR
jgi:hypothetical protein